MDSALDQEQLIQKNQALVQNLANLGYRFESSVKLLSAITRLTSVPLRSTNLEEAASDVLTILVRELNDIESSSILMYDPKESLLKILSARGQADLLGLEEDIYNPDLAFKPGEGVAGKVYQENRPYFWDRNSCQFELLKYYPGMTIPEALACLPLTVSDRTMGVLNVSFGSPKPFDHARKRDLALLSGVVANVIQTFTLKAELDAQANSLRRKVRECETEILERGKAERALAASEEKYRRIVETATEGIFIIDGECRLLFVNRRMATMLGYTVEEMMNRSLFEFMDEENRRVAESHLTGKIQAGEEVHDLKFIHMDDREVWTILSTSPLGETGDTFHGALGMATDITSRKLAEDQILAALVEKEVLLREIHHRVKNNMQVISSMIRIHSRHIEEPEMRQVFRECQDRVMAMAMTHEVLYQTDNLAYLDLNRYIGRLAASLFNAYSRDRETIDLNVESDRISLNIDQAVPCGLVINELISNSLKHGFPNGAGGEIRIQALQEEGGNVQITVSDNGVGMPEDLDIRNTETLGLQIVLDLVEGQLGGQVSFRRENGTSVHITFQSSTYEDRI